MESASLEKEVPSSILESKLIKIRNDVNADLSSYVH